MPSATVDVTNHYNSHNWLTSIADVINTWISGSARAEKLNRRDDI